MVIKQGLFNKNIKLRIIIHALKHDQESRVIWRNRLKRMEDRVLDESAVCKKINDRKTWMETITKINVGAFFIPAIQSLINFTDTSSYPYYG